MAERAHFDNRLRGDYDSYLFDRDQRRRQAGRIRRLLRDMGLWRRGARLLDVGCGSGFKLAFLRDDSCRMAVGCDIRDELYRRVKAELGGVMFVQASGDALPFADGVFDIVTCVSVVGEFDDVAGAFREMTRCLAPGGILYLTVTNGNVLEPLYRLFTAVGGHIPEAWLRYAQNGRRIIGLAPERNFSVEDPSRLRFIDLTAAMIRQELPLTRLVPTAIMTHVAGFLSPTHVYCWVKSKDGKDMPCAE